MTSDTTAAWPAEHHAFSTEEDRFWCAREAGAFAVALGMSPAAARAVALAAAELVGNAARHGGGGAMRLRAATAGEPGVEVAVADVGGGGRLDEACFEDGYSRGTRRVPGDPPRSGLGLGLGAARRLMDRVEVRALGGGRHAVVAFKAVGHCQARRAQIPACGAPVEKAVWEAQLPT
jgi:anti-sigma regulatory factor (Ser/Thr protein kinase)